VIDTASVSMWMSVMWVKMMPPVASGRGKREASVYKGKLRRRVWRQWRGRHVKVEEIGNRLAVKGRMK
jgi:hypothetical protein